MARKVVVTDISASASEKVVKDFFLFCGKIKEFELIKEECSDKQIAYVVFERESAAKTALMLTNAVIGDSPIKVCPADDLHQNGSDESYDGEGLAQEDKPKGIIFAEILAAGYQLQDHIIQKGLAYDEAYGISERVRKFISSVQENILKLDAKYKVVETVTAKASEIDARFAVQDKVKYAAAQAQETATYAFETSTGKRIAEFYNSTFQNVSGVHAMARKIADDKRAERDVTEVTH